MEDNEVITTLQITQARMEEKLDNITILLGKHIDSEEKINKNHDERIRDVEMWKANFAGKVYVFVSIIAFIGTIVGPIIVNMWTK
jgi:hypothetical protein